MNIKRYPAVFAHLKQWERELKAREDQGEHWWELRSCAYYDLLDKPKILFPDMAKESRFALDGDGTYVTNTTYVIPRNDRFLLGVLNSSAIWFFAKNTFSSLGDAEEGGRLLIDFFSPGDLVALASSLATRSASQPEMEIVEGMQEFPNTTQIDLIAPAAPEESDDEDLYSVAGFTV